MFHAYCIYLETTNELICWFSVSICALSEEQSLSKSSSFAALEIIKKVKKSFQ